MDGLAFYRVGNWCHRRGVPVVPVVMKAFTRLLLSSHVPCEATIGQGSILGYGGLGTVIHQRAVIGENVMIGTRVTVGGRSHERDVPIIEDDVFIGAGACVLGPVRVGRGAVIGANAVVIEDVPPRSVVAGVPAKVIRKDIDSRDFGDLPDTLRARKKGKLAHGVA